jgi:hypothetical protein
MSGLRLWHLSLIMVPVMLHLVLVQVVAAMAERNDLIDLEPPS